MDKLIRKIIEIDKKAQEIADEANSASAGLSSETEAEIQKIRSEYDEKLKAELEGIAARKTVLQAEHRKIQREEKECNIVLQNVCDLLDSPQLRPHLHNYEIE